MLICSLFMLLALTAGAQELRHQDFEDQIPGNIPRHWRHAWGKQDDDLLLVSNMQAASGKQSLLLDRASSTNTAQWGASTSLPSPDDGWLCVSVAFRIDGKGNNACFGIELRNGPVRVTSLGFRHNRVSVRTNMPEAPAALRGGALGSYVPCQWHRLRLWLPTREKPGPDAWVQLERRTTTGHEAVGKPVAVACTMAQHPNAVLMLNMAPGKRDFRLNLDDLVCERLTALPDWLEALPPRK